MEKKQLWLDISDLQDKEGQKLLNYAVNVGYNGVLINEKQLSLMEKVSRNIITMIKINKENKERLKKYTRENSDRRILGLIDGNDEKLIDDVGTIEKGIFITIDDKKSMERAIELSPSYKTIVIQFQSVTNIPLELILAYSQEYKNTICKIISNSEDGWIATMTMEMGSQAVLIKTSDIEELNQLKKKIDNLINMTMEIEELKVEEIKHIGMGDRVCIDTISKLDNDEGMILGSTSSGGILVSSENHYLPYMDLRPFRVNAGAIHSYILCPDNKYRYLSELQSGDEVMVINSKGRARAVSVGRIKMEKRPMLLIKTISKNGKPTNVIVQDDWHIRIISSKGEVKNSVLLTKGDVVLGCMMKEGRHLGVAIDETIIEK
ncbi:MAG: 3-dehydroquinate synthase II [Lachnospiraceae bacterium]|nr:3-dehydroquinate synthase II [Lachnospiraceae bacterium]